MQSINVIFTSLVAAICIPILLLTLSAFTLYNTIKWAKYAKRRNEEMFKTIELARTQVKDNITAKR